MASLFFSFRLASKMSMASWVQPMLEPSAMNLAPAATSASASSLLTSFWVADGRATSTLPTWSHGRAPWTYLYLDLVSNSLSGRRLTLSSAMASISSGEMTLSPSATREPWESDSDTTVAPSSMHFSAAYCATLPEPEIATRLPDQPPAPA